MVADELGFAELQERIPDISSKVLSDDLEELEEKGLVNREIVNEKPFRVKYSLTERGRSLEPVIEDMMDWGTDYLETSGPPP
jgi:DNA-binding HxlR family transcriptional regulator